MANQFLFIAASLTATSTLTYKVHTNIWSDKPSDLRTAILLTIQSIVSFAVIVHGENTYLLFDVYGNDGKIYSGPHGQG